MEEWRDVKGYEGFYQVSSLGRVRSVDRLVTHSRNSRYKVNRKGKDISVVDHGNGYLYVSFCVDMVRKNYYVHRLVAEAFIENQDNLPEVDHINRNRADNRAENLRWVTRKGNLENAEMGGQRSKCRPSSTGYKYIRKRGNKFRVAIRRKDLNVDRSFLTLEEAIKFRDGITEVI